MIAQRPPTAAPAVKAVAEQLPIRTDAVDAALAVLTVHHWTDLDRGIAELKTDRPPPDHHPHLGPHRLPGFLAGP
ncbi:methyltransferase domain-containing protein [Nocardia sp. CA-084685]|uniref:methyltransferase domain-containing protein n=1 Tax=Nocardia sp. CA-084685 TaxID=3239970 RepID=UPI003D95D07E